MRHGQGKYSCYEGDQLIFEIAGEWSRDEMCATISLETESLTLEGNFA